MVRKRRILFILLKAMQWALLIAAAAIVTAWLVGRFLTDRFAWSQWLWWVPTLVALAAAVVFAILIALPGSWGTADRGSRRKRALAICGIVLLGMGGYFLLIDHRFLGWGAAAEEAGTSISIGHWMLGQMPPPRQRADHAEALFDMRADILVLTAPDGILWHDSLRDYLREGEQMIQLGKFVIITRFAVGAPAFLRQENDQQITALPVDTREALGEGIVIWMADFPSQPRTPRMEFARGLSRLIAERGLPAPDVVLGDFNITRGSASIDEVFDGLALHHAYDDSGSGYGASFPRVPIPLWHIDHVYLASKWRAATYEVFDPGVGRHRAQRAVITAAE